MRKLSAATAAVFASSIFLGIAGFTLVACTAQERADLHSVCVDGQKAQSYVAGVAAVGKVLMAGAPTWVSDLDALAPSVGGSIVSVLCQIDDWVAQVSHGEQIDPAAVTAAKQRAATYRKMRTPVILSAR